MLKENTVFVTGGTSGIGRGLAEAFYRRGNQVIISGRRQERLRETCAKNPGMASYPLDVTDARAIQKVAERATQDFPALNWVVNNAGIQMSRGFPPESPFDDESLQAEIATNLMGVIRVAAAFVPHLAGRRGATLVNVSSGLAFVPMARFAVYCATKAAVHSWTLSLRHQLRSSGIKVIELIPPWVASELGGQDKPSTLGGRGPMPLDAFVEETMKAFDSGEDDLAIADAKRLAAAACPETVRKVFAAMNQ